MKFRNEEEREAYAKKTSGLTEMGLSFIYIASVLTQDPKHLYNTTSRCFNGYQETIKNLCDEYGVLHTDTEDCFRLTLTDKGAELYAKYMERWEVYHRIMNDYE